MELIVNDVNITTDSEGRYSLNDLHRAAGGRAKDKPALFMQNKSFKDFSELLKVGDPTFNPVIRKQGRYGGGTWVCKELVYKYAMWINPTFELKVIQTFDKLSKMSESTGSMKALNDLSKVIEADKDLASKCGVLLANYKKQKKINKETWDREVKKAQLTLGFRGLA